MYFLLQLRHLLHDEHPHRPVIATSGTDTNAIDMAQKTGFMSLPVELRQQIYDQIYKNPKIHVDHFEYGDIKLRHRVAPFNLFKVSKQIRNEALPRFQLELRYVGKIYGRREAKPPVSFLGLSGTIRNCVTNLVIDDRFLANVRFDQNHLPNFKRMVIQAAGERGEQDYHHNRCSFELNAGNELVPSRWLSNVNSTLIKHGLLDTIIVRVSEARRIQKKALRIGRSVANSNVEVYFRNKYLIILGTPE